MGGRIIGVIPILVGICWIGGGTIINIVMFITGVVWLVMISGVYMVIMFIIIVCSVGGIIIIV